MTAPMTPDFGEPWTIENGKLADREAVLLYKAEFGYEVDWLDKAQRDRCIEAVNALAGIANPAAIPALIEACEGALKAYAFQQHGAVWSYLRQMSFELESLRAVAPQPNLCERGHPHYIRLLDGELLCGQCGAVYREPADAERKAE